MDIIIIFRGLGVVYFEQETGASHAVPGQKIQHLGPKAESGAPILYFSISFHHLLHFFTYFHTTSPSPYATKVQRPIQRVTDPTLEKVNTAAMHSVKPMAHRE